MISFIPNVMRVYSPTEAIRAKQHTSPLFVLVITYSYITR